MKIKVVQKKGNQPDRLGRIGGFLTDHFFFRTASPSVTKDCKDSLGLHGTLVGYAVNLHNGKYQFKKMVLSQFFIITTLGFP